MSASLEPATVVAVDLGAGSGRVCAVTAEGGRLGVSEVNRFTNRPVEAGGTLYWDILELWREVRAGLDLALPLRPDSVGVDSWGVDFALLDDRGELLGNPVHYRDSRTHGLLGELLERVPPELVFAATGIQFMPINTSVQLLSLARRQDPRLEAAKTLLMIPDVMHHWLCGASVGEHTNATTTQLFDPLARRWSPRMLEGIGVDERLFPAVVEPGTRLGEAQGVPVIAPRYPRHRQRGRGGPRRRLRLRIRLVGDVEPRRPRGRPAVPRSGCVGRERHERRRRARHDEAVEERGGALDPPTVPRALERRG